MNNRPLNKENPRNIKCEHCEHFAESNETRWGYPIMKCNCEDSKWHNTERRSWNRCKCFEWHKKYDNQTDKGGAEK